ncbi:MAG: tetratricopeptide repeat protein [Opitutaceae bacterium]|nr:tetratricopeptide repeat protein [Opitutaceae bacterium]
MKARTIGVIAACAVLVAGGGFGILHYQELGARKEAAIASLPSRPTLSSLPSELQRRVEAAEREVRRGEDPAGALSLLATLYHANGYEAEAADCYRGLLRADPDNPRWAHNLAHLLAGYGRADEAIVLWRHVEELAPEYVPALIRLGDVLIKADRWDEAERAYLAGLEVAPRDPYLLAGLARVDVQKGRLDGARDKLEAATDASEFRIGNALLVTVYEKLGLKEKAEAVRAQAKSFGTFFDAPDPWLDAIYDECYDAYRLTLGAGMADRRGDRATALRLLDRAVRLHPDYFLAHYQLGSLHEKGGALDRSELHLRRAAELNPTFGDAWLGLYRVAGAARGRSAALSALQEGLARCPDSPGLRLEYGRHLRDQRRPAEALREFRKVYELRPAEVDALIEIAQIQFAQGQVQEGAATLKLVLDIVPAHPVALSTLCFFSITSGNQLDSREWLRQCRNQPRLSREDLQRLASAYQSRFGESPW